MGNASGRRFRLAFLAFLLLASSKRALSGDASLLTFQDRVAAQKAIERVYHSHQLGPARPFEEAVPPDVLERKVRTYLKQSVALAEFWKTAVTPQALQAERERIERQTRLPDRLWEIYQALGNDPVLIHECFVRPVLVDRLSRNFFAFDPEIHAAARAEASRLHEQLAERTLRPSDPDPRRTVVELRRRALGEGRPNALGHATREGGASSGIRQIELGPEEFDRVRATAPDAVGKIGRLREEREVFAFRVVLEASAETATVATYEVRKRSWEGWWEGADQALDASRVDSRMRAGDRAAFPPLRHDRGFPSARCEEAGMPAAALPGSCVPDDSWDNGSLDDVPSARYGHSAVWTGTLMVVWGGYDWISFLDSGGRYDPVTDTWTPTSRTGAPSRRWSHTAVWTGSVMVVWGGEAAAEVGDTDTGGRYDPVTDTWIATSTSGAPSPRHWHSAVWTGARMIVWGGTRYPAFPTMGGLYDPVTDTWTPTTTTGVPLGRSFHSAIWTGEEMIVWGGEIISGATTAEGGRYDPATDTWSPTSMSGAPSARARHTAVWTGDLMVVWGGRTDSGGGVTSNRGSRYDPETDAWTPLSTSGAPSRRADHTAVWTGSRMLVWGGHDPVIGYQNGGGRYDPVADRWAPSSAIGAPSARAGHTAAWTGSLMVVWGGFNGATPVQEGVLETGGRYDPGSDSWTPTSRDQGPSARDSHAAVWTGSHMIVWGGIDRVRRRNTGGRYDPVTDSWTPTSVTGAPTARGGHTAIWADGMMIVWGGFDSILNYANTGGRYDPVSDSWTPTSVTGAPTARGGHTAIWADGMMIVWGGEVYNGGYVATDTGGRYDPSSDTWAPISLSGAPSARIYHSAVWTGHLMVVWGGAHDSLGDQNTGGRYDPIGDTWAPTSTIDAPSERSGHTAVWTGNVMIVWGGTGLPYPNSGGRYEPVNDTWAPTSTSGPPSGRVLHTAVWTGDLMVVWGGSTGYDDGGSLVATDTGGRYDPVADAWTTTATAGSPGERFGHTAVWARGLMIVWGGGLSGIAPGGRYAAGDAMDLDGDGVADCQDVCPSVPDPGQADQDGDGVGDRCDNCAAAPNADQADSDRDGAGDACDPAFDPVALVLSPENVAVARGSRLGFQFALFSNLPSDERAMLALSTRRVGGTERLLPAALTCLPENPWVFMIVSGGALTQSCYVDIPATTSPGLSRLILRVARDLTGTFLQDEIGLLVTP